MLKKMLKGTFRQDTKGLKRDNEKTLLALELSEVKEVADIIFKRLEKKIEELSAIEASVDEKISRFERLVQSTEALKASVDNLNREQEIIALRKKGIRVDEIADIVGMPAGEIALILNLNKGSGVFPENQSDAGQKRVNPEYGTLFNSPESRKIDGIDSIPDDSEEDVKLSITHHGINEAIPKDSELANAHINYRMPVEDKISGNAFSRKAILVFSLLLMAVVLSVYLWISQKNSVTSPLKSQVVVSGQPLQQKPEGSMEKRPREQEISPENKVQAHQEEKKQIKTITVISNANLRSKPSLNSEAVEWVKKGVVFDIIEEITDSDGKKWYKVLTSTGKECWVADRVVNLKP